MATVVRDFALGGFSFISASEDAGRAIISWQNAMLNTSPWAAQWTLGEQKGLNSTSVTQMN